MAIRKFTDQERLERRRIASLKWANKNKERTSIKGKENRDNKKKKGICVVCPKRAVKGKTYCKNHLIYNSKRAKKRHDNIKKSLAELDKKDKEIRKLKAKLKEYQHLTP